jgi:hypothetical protein
MHLATAPHLATGVAGLSVLSPADRGRAPGSTLRSGHDPEQHREGGGLAGPVGAQEGADRPLLYGEAHPMYGAYLAEALGYLMYLDRRQPWPLGCPVVTVLTAHVFGMLDYGQI